MEITQAFERIDRFLQAKQNNSGGQVYIVNVSNLDALSEIRARYMYRLLKASSLCREDHLLGRHDLINALCKRNEPTVLMEFTSLWKLYGYRALAEELIFLQDYAFAYPLVIVGYKIEESLRILAKDPRREQRIIWIEWDGSNLPQIEPNFAWIGHDVSVQKLIDQQQFCANIQGIQNIASCIENENLKLRQYGKRVLVHTQARKADFIQSVYHIEEINSPFSVVVMHDSTLNCRNETEGTDEQWLYLLQKLDALGSFEAVVLNELGLEKGQLHLLDQYSVWQQNQRWLHWIALRQYGTRHIYLERVLECTKDYTQFIRNLYRCIDELSPRTAEFEKMYNDRKLILKSLRDMESEAAEYAQWVMQKSFDALYYLTDLSKHEQEAFLRIFAIHLGQHTPGEVIKKLETRCTKLADYVKPMALSFPHYISSEDQKYIERYFDRYRYLKLVNHMDDDFEATVANESKVQGRRFYRFKQRDVRLDEILKTADNIKTIALFIDALGVEFIPYLSRHAKNHSLKINTEIYQANLPTVTCYNTQFRQWFENKIEIRDSKRIDELKHRAIPDSQYEKTDVPIHLLEELDEIDKLLILSKQLLNSGDCERVLWISDHGASRLAVLSKAAKTVNVSTKGEHGGRYCLDCDVLKDAEDVIHVEVEDSQYAVNAGYNRFCGDRTRKPTVETHGGATLEEVLVPLVIVTLPQNTDNIEIVNQSPQIKVGPKQCVKIQLFSKKAISELTIRFTGKYNGQTVTGKSNDGQIYYFECHFIKTSGTYTFDILYRDNVIGQETVKAVSIGMQMNDDFF